jgi:2-polyprenyl-3-methyl-5-hydroxy-6-metoxy-1,4-benzoquinol methylase
VKQLDRFIQRWRIHKAAAFIEPGASILDVGCADGALFRLLPRLGDSVGIDPDLARPETPLPNVRLYPGLFPDALPQPRQFDAIVMLAVLEHVPMDRLEALARDCAAHLKPGGRLIITVPAPAVDHILAVLKGLRLIDGMSLEQHHGFEVASTPGLFTPHGFDLVVRKGFQLGLNTLFVFERNGHAKRV